MVDWAFHRRRAVTGFRRTGYVLRHGRAAKVTPVFIFGAQRSGTTMLLDRLKELPEIVCYGEKSIAFERAYLKDRRLVGELIDRCKVPFVAFKPLTSSHEVADLLALREGARALWLFRRAEDRANSAVAQFADDNLQALKRIAGGLPIDTWHVRGLSAASRAILAQFPPEHLTAHDAAGLMWLVRNRLFFEQDLASRDDVLLVCYEDLVADPRRIFQGICRFIGLPYEERMAAGVHKGSVGKAAPKLSEAIRARCEECYRALQAAAGAQWQRLESFAAEPH